MTITKSMWMLAISLHLGPVGPLVPALAVAPAARADDVADPIAGSATKSIPAGAKEIVAAMKSAKVGETITLHGRVAPAKDAFDTKSAIVTIVDETADPSRFTAKEVPA